MTRRFEFVGGNSAKFWECGVTGNQVTVRYGRLATDGQAQTKEFTSPESAQKHADTLIVSKLNKGYVECPSA